MIWDFHKIYRFSLYGLGFWLQLSSLGQARHYDENRRSTIGFEVGGGLTTYKSKLVESNDTTTSSGYRLIFHSGAENTAAAVLENTTQNTNFELNQSLVQIINQDVQFRKYWGPVYFGLMFSTTNIASNKESTNQIDAIGNGMGGIFGLNLHLGSANLGYFNYRTVSGSAAKDALGNEVALGSRSELQIGGKLGWKKRWYYLDVGLRYTNFSVTVAGTSYAELNITTWFGLGASTMF